MIQTEIKLAGLRTLVTGQLDHARLLVVMLHGYTMQPEDLAPFTQTLRVGHTAYALPQAPMAVAHGGHTWWTVNEAARLKQIEHGPRDLADARPAELPAARAAVELLLTELRQRAPHARLVLGGFSQGGMLASDVALHTAHQLDGLFLLSASLINQAEWAPLFGRLGQLPVLIAHGRSDPNLAFAAGERLRDALLQGGADVNWLPFDGGHQIPLTVWRQLRKFLQSQAKRHADHDTAP